MPPPRKRAELLLVERGLFESRARAQAAIEAGLVIANDKPVAKPSETHRQPTPCCRRSPRIPTSRAAASSWRARWSNTRSRSRTMSVSTSAHRPAASPRSCSPTAPAWCSPSMSGTGSCIPRCADHPKIVSMEATDIRSFEGKRLPTRPDIVVIDVSFISLKAVLPVALSLAAAPMHLLALIKPQFEAPRKTFQARHHPRRDGASAGLRRHRGLRGLARLHRHRGVSVVDQGRRRQYRILPRRAPWLNASSSTMSAIAATASPLPAARPCTCPTRSAARPSRSKPVPGHPDRRRLLAIERASPERIAPFCQHFGVCGGCAIQHWETERYRAWKRQIVVETLAQAGIDCEVDAAGRCPRRSAAGASRACPAAAAMSVLQGRLRRGQFSHDIVPVDRCPILDPGAARRARRGLGAGRAPEADRQAARYPGHRHR